MRFELVGAITEVRTIATGSSVRARARLRKRYGEGRWSKRKGIATVRFSDGTISKAELHWYEAHGVGKRELKIKRLVEQAGNKGR